MKYEIFKAIEEKDINLLYDLTSKCIVIDGFSFIIKEEEGTTSLFYTINSGKFKLIDGVEKNISQIKASLLI